MTPSDDTSTAKEQSENSKSQPKLNRICIEAAFLSTAFGPDFLDKEVTRNQFLAALRLGQPQSDAARE